MQIGTGALIKKKREREKREERKKDRKGMGIICAVSQLCIDTMNQLNDPIVLRLHGGLLAAVSKINSEVVVFCP